MPGTPIIYYGDEIGMGDNIYLGDRNGVRTPMQWTPDRNGGFSRADPAQLYLPLHHGSGLRLRRRQRRGADALAVVAAELDEAPDQRAQIDARFRPRHADFHPARQPRVLAYVRQLGDEAILCVANLSRSAQAVELDMALERPHAAGNAGPHALPAHRRTAYLVTLPPYGFFWFSLNIRPQSEPENVLPRDITTLVLGAWLGKRAVELDPPHLRG